MDFSYLDGITCLANPSYILFGDIFKPKYQYNTRRDIKWTK